MKWFFFLLLLANIGLFIWIYPQLSEPEVGAGLPADVNSLTLLSEVNKVSDGLPDKTKNDSEKEETGGLMVEQVVTQSESKQKKPVKQGLPESALLQPKPEAVIQEQLQAIELPDKEEVRGGSIDQKLALHCSTIGPLAERADADKLSLRLRTMGLQPNLNSESTNDQEGYWVMVPPQRTRAQAVAIVKRLQEAGITDLWRFTSGNLARAISLGLFRNEARAEIRRKSIADKGFNVEVRPRYRQKTKYWLSFSFTGESPVTAKIWAEMVEIYPGVEQRSIDCLEIATE